MRNGTDWEEKIEGALHEMTARGIMHTIVKTEAPVRIIKWVRGAQALVVFTAPGMCDFEGGYQGAAVCIEAKETRQTRLSFSDRKTFKSTQLCRLDATLETGGISGVMVRYRPLNGVPECWGIPWALKKPIARGTDVWQPSRSFNLRSLGAYGALKFGHPIGPTSDELVEFLELCKFTATVGR